MENTENSYQKFILCAKALADESRLKIIEMLSCGEMCACDLLEGLTISQPTLSYHMKKLIESEVVQAREDGSWMYYSLNPDCFLDMISFLKQMTHKRETCICHFEKEEGDNEKNECI